MYKVHNIKSSISSALANISANVPSSSVKGVSISFDREMLNTTVKYENGQLTFSEIPDSLRSAIEEELEDEHGETS